MSLQRYVGTKNKNKNENENYFFHFFFIFALDVGLLCQEEDMDHNFEGGGGASGLDLDELRPLSLLLSNVIGQVCTKSAAGCNRRKTTKQFVRTNDVSTVAFRLNCVNDLRGSSSEEKSGRSKIESGLTTTKEHTMRIVAKRVQSANAGGFKQLVSNERRGEKVDAIQSVSDKTERERVTSYEIPLIQFSPTFSPGSSTRPLHFRGFRSFRKKYIVDHQRTFARCCTATSAPACQPTKLQFSDFRFPPN